MSIAWGSIGPCNLCGGVIRHQRDCEHRGIRLVSIGRRWRRLTKPLREWWQCRRHLCLYYSHYLSYGPADLTHAGYHSAERKCEEAQVRVGNWYKIHQTGEPPRYLVQIAEDWERRIRA